MKRQGGCEPTAWRIVSELVALPSAAGRRRGGLAQAAAVVVVIVVVVGVGAAGLPRPGRARGGEVVGRLLRRLTEVAVAGLPA